MIVLEFKLKGKAHQYRIIDEMIRTAQFVRNKTLKYWTENQGVKLVNLYKQCAIMAKEFEWASKLNSMARQASAERAIFAIQRFFANCKAKKPGKKGYPQFKKHTRSVEYKTSGWSLSTDKRCLTFKDGFAAGKFKLAVVEICISMRPTKSNESELCVVPTATTPSFVSMWSEKRNLFPLVKLLG